jgi:hypothetical protein
MESQNIMVWSRWALEAWQGFPGNGGIQNGYPRTDQSQGTTHNLFISFLQVVVHGFEEFEEQKHHGLEYMALGSSESRHA